MSRCEKHLNMPHEASTKLTISRSPPLRNAQILGLCCVLRLSSCYWHRIPVDITSLLLWLTSWRKAILD